MCCRYELSEAPRRLKAFFKLETLPPSVAGTEVRRSECALIIRQQLGHRLAARAAWGLAAAGAGPGEKGETMFSVGIEAVAEHPELMAILRRRRCLVPVTAFYDFLSQPGKPQGELLRLSHRDGIPIAFAGIWESWRPSGSDETIHRYAIMAAGGRRLPGRLPLILDEAAWDRWLDPRADDLVLQQSLLQPSPVHCLVVQSLGR